MIKQDDAVYSGFKRYFNWRPHCCLYLKERKVDKMKRIHKISGVSVTFYKGFNIHNGFYLQDTELPKSLTWWSLVEFDRLKRRTKRKVVNKFLGKSLNASRNENIIRNNSLKVLNINRIKRLLLGKSK